MIKSHKVIKALKRLVHSISIFPYIFLSLFIFSRVTLLLICNFELEKDLDTSCNFSLVFILKYFYSCCYCYCYFGYRLPARDTRRLDYLEKEKNILDQPKILYRWIHSRPMKKILDRPKKFSAHENKSRDQYQFSKGRFATRVMNVI